MSQRHSLASPLMIESHHDVQFGSRLLPCLDHDKKVILLQIKCDICLNINRVLLLRCVAGVRLKR
jgi:hypothetical protein